MYDDQTKNIRKTFKHSNEVLAPNEFFIDKHPEPVDRTFR